MAELVDALDLGSSVSDVQVRVLSGAQNQSQLLIPSDWDFCFLVLEIAELLLSFLSVILFRKLEDN